MCPFCYASDISGHIEVLYNPKKIDIHAFADASERLYASLVYLRVVYEFGKIKIYFIASIAIVSPMMHQEYTALNTFDG